MQQSLETIRKDFIANILRCYEGTLPIADLIIFATSLSDNPALTGDLSFQQCFALLDFLSQQLASGNKDLVSPLVRESCAYMLEKLTPNKQYIS